MADTFRYRYGETNPVTPRIATTQAVAIGDLTYLSGGYLIRAEDFAAAHISTLQNSSSPNFLGVVGQRKRNTDTTPGHGGGLANRIRVATEGVFEFDTYASTFGLGDLVGPAQAASGSTLESQKVVLVGAVGLAIGRVAEPKISATSTKVKVRIFSKVMLGGPQA